MSTYFAHRPIDNNGLVFLLDPYNSKTHVSGTTTAYSLTKDKAEGTMINGIGYDGKSFLFDGTDDWIDFTETSSLNGYTGSFTISVWIKTTFVNNLSNFLEIPNLGIIGYYRLASTRHWRFLVDNNSWLQATPNIDNPAGVLINLVGTYNSTTQESKIYLNGVLNNSVGSVTAPDGGNGQINIQSDPGAWTGYYYRGVVWTRCLTDDEVLTDYEIINKQTDRFI
jgi:hypothetical protein